MIQADECGAFSFERGGVLCLVTWHQRQQNSDVWLEKFKARHTMTTWLNYKDWAHHHTGITPSSPLGDGSLSYLGNDLFLFLVTVC